MIDELDVLPVAQVPQALVLHDDGEVVGYVLTTPERVYAIRRDGREVIQSTSLDQFESFWLAHLGCDLARPEPA